MMELIGVAAAGRTRRQSDFPRQAPSRHRSLTSQKERPVRQMRWRLHSKWIPGIVLCSLLGWSSAALPGQHTDVRDAGGGRKVELVYDAAGQVVETRTTDQSGKLLVLAKNEYRQGFLVPQHTAISYWPDGNSIRSVASATFDENGNFTGELKQEFDQSAKQTGGTKLTHDPFTGIYRCALWNAPARDYQPSPCPSTEGSGETPEKPKDLTQEEVTKKVESARQSRANQEKSQPMEPKSPTSWQAKVEMTDVGVILPAELGRGERVSGSVVLNPQDYEGVYALQVIRMKLPIELKGQTPTLRSWVFETEGDGPQRADEAVTLSVPRDASDFGVTLHPQGDPSKAVSARVSIHPNPPDRKLKPSQEFEVAAMCLKGDLCLVRGPFSGDSARTLIAFDDQPARIVAETSEASYISIPAGVKTGLSHLIVADGLHAAALLVDVAEIGFAYNHQELQTGQFRLVHAMLSGPEDLPDNLWSGGTFPPEISVERARTLVPDFDVAQEGEGGRLLFVIRNATSEAFSLRGSKNQTFAFRLTPDSFEHGEFKFQFVVDALKPGRFAVRGSVLPFLAPLRGQQFTIKPTD